MKKVWDRVGGVLRALVAPDEVYSLYRQQLDRSASSIDIEKLLENHSNAAEGPPVDNRTYSLTASKALHFAVENFAFAGLQLCSRYFFIRWLQKRQSSTPIEDVLGESKKGIIFENEVVTKLAFAGTFLVRPLEGDGKAPVSRVALAHGGGDATVLLLRSRRISDYLKEEHPPGKPLMLIPISKRYVAFDAFLWSGKRWYALQVTINQQKRLNATHLNEFFDAHRQVPRELYVVMPAEQAATRIKPFSFEKGGNAVEQKTPLNQFLLPFPTNRCNLKKFEAGDREALFAMRERILEVAMKKGLPSRSDEP